MNASTTKQRRARVVAICDRLPEATHSSRDHIRFEVRGKTFVYYLDNHHGDGRIALNCKVAPGDQDVLLRMDPERFFIPAYLGAKGWIGVRIDLDEIDWPDITQLIHDSYRLIAPKRLAASISEGGLD
jgi:phosphoribosylglycinamide formyltransferase-1